MAIAHRSLTRWGALTATVLLLAGMAACGRSSTIEGTRESPERIAVVVAHPDDETALGGALPKYAREAKVHLVVAADGRWGVTEHAGIPAGDSLVFVRSKEAKCSAERHGLASIHLLDAHDGLGMRGGAREYFPQTYKLRDDLRRVLESLSPQLIVTFGPDGDSGHADHRIVSALVTELRLLGAPSTGPDLLYLAWTKEQADLYEEILGPLSHVDGNYIDTAVRFTSHDEEKAWNRSSAIARSCRKTRSTDGSK